MFKCFVHLDRQKDILDLGANSFLPASLFRVLSCHKSCLQVFKGSGKSMEKYGEVIYLLGDRLVYTVVATA